MASKWKWVGLCALSLTMASPAIAKESHWSKATVPQPGPAQAIGGYSAGCVQGAVALPLNGTGFQRMRPARKREFGHPVLISFITELGRSVAEKNLGPLLIGDLGQVQGGPAPRGHASHQSGLDVDIWFWHPKDAETRLLTEEERQSTSARSLVNKKKKSINGNWNSKIPKILRIAASSPEVAKIFVNPLIKKRLCETKGKHRSYLRKIRPWYGHADHMHVRLKCPTDSADCEAQADLPKGDGCADVGWWLDEKAQEARRKRRKNYQSKVGTLPQMPVQCQAFAEGKN